MDDMLRSDPLVALDNAVPSHVKVLDEWGRLESRVRFYRAGAESIARDWIDPIPMDPMLRGGDDLLDHVMAFEELLKAHFATVEPGANRE